MTSRVVLATRNAAKLAEMRRILLAAGPDLRLVGVQGFPGVPDVRETGATFAENAKAKATTVAAATGLVTVAEDSGLVVDALNGMPGVLSARWSGGYGDDGANLRLLLGQLMDVPAERRGAAFICAAVVATPDGRLRLAEGRVAGRLTEQPRGHGGFGYDPVFVPEGDHRTTAEMPAADKDAVSHRGRALRALVPLLRELLASGRAQPASPG